MNITANMLTMAPLAISAQRELIISISEYNDTPKVDAKNPTALVTIDGSDVDMDVIRESSELLPSSRSRLYLVVSSIA